MYEKTTKCVQKSEPLNASTEHKEATFSLTRSTQKQTVFAHVALHDPDSTVINHKEMQMVILVLQWVHLVLNDAKMSVLWTHTVTLNVGVIH